MSFMNKIVEILKNGGIGILPTNTIYGIVASALDEKAVLRVYGLRKRNPEKPFIILISSYNDLNLFGIELTVPIKKVLDKIWPGKVSVILSYSAEASCEGETCESEKFEYLHRGTRTLAFRFPNKKDLIELLKETGPLIAPSANFEGEPPALTIKEARDYFGDKVDFYEDAGKLDSPPSTLVKIDIDGGLEVLREGAVKIVL